MFAGICSLDLVDKIIENRCTYSFYRHFCVIKIQKLLAQSLPKQFVGDCKQIKIQRAKISRNAR